MNIEDFVTYEQALALKKLGFTYPTYHYIDESDMEWCNNGDFINWNNSSNDIVSISTLAQAQKWLREAKELIICIEPRFYKGKRPFIGYSFHINEKENRPFTYIESDGVFTSYEQALSAGITECLKLLEK